MKLHIVSLGCTKNLVDTEVMLGRLKDMQLTSDPQEADVIIVNTCGFIDAAKEESLNTVLSLHQQRKQGSLLVMAGCLSERYKEELQKELPEVDIFTGVGDYARIDELLAKKESRFTPNVYLIHDEERIVTGSSFHAYIKLSEGCNQQCSFCAIPSFKGKLHSRPLESIVAEVKRLVDAGYRDFTFVSQDSSSYGRDLQKPEALIELIETIDQIDGIDTARILYLYPTTTSSRLIDAIAAAKRFVNYFDMPIQHISERMLKRMKRGAGRDRTLELLEQMRKIEDSFLRTTIIVGHPGESEEEFAELCTFLESFDFDRVNVFAYSDEEGTPAFAMDGKVSPEVIEERLARVESILTSKLHTKLDQEIGKRRLAYLEGESEESDLLLSAREIRWAPEVDGEILINDSQTKELEPGGIYEVAIDERVGEKLLGHIVTRKG